LKRLDPELNEWKSLAEPVTKHHPKERFGHSLNQYRNYLVMFGGAGHFNHEIKRREAFNDFFMYDFEADRWFDPVVERDREDFKAYKMLHVNSHHTDDNTIATQASLPPIKRMGHAAAVLGCALIIHGGINGEENVVIADGKDP
jgi:Galactose oxidase, central domain